MRKVLGSGVLVATLALLGTLAPTALADNHTSAPKFPKGPPCPSWAPDGGSSAGSGDADVKCVKPDGKGSKKKANPEDKKPGDGAGGGGGATSDGRPEGKADHKPKAAAEDDHGTEVSRPATAVRAQPRFTG